MNRHALRSVCSRARPELEQVSGTLRTSVRPFSTTQLQAADDSTPKPTLRERSRVATSQINSLARDRNPTQNAQPRAPPVAGGARPKVIDVKSLPRMPLRSKLARGGTGKFGAARAGPSAGSALPPRLGPDGKPLRFRGKPGQGNQKAGGPRGKFAARKKKTGGEGGEKDKERKAAGAPDKIDHEVEEFQKALRYGESALFNPSLNLESLSGLAPAVPSTNLGRGSTILHNLSVLGTADPVGASQVAQAHHTAKDLENNGARFFADLKDKVVVEKHILPKWAKDAEEFYKFLQKARPEAAERYLKHLQTQKPQATGQYLQHLSLKKAEGEAAAKSKALVPAEENTQTEVLKGADENVRKAILGQAVQGQHETPKFASDPVGLSRSWHLRAETYTLRDVNSFEKKLTTLLASRPAAKAKPAAKQPVKEQAKDKGKGKGKKAKAKA